MQYMLLIYGDDRLRAEMPREEAARLEDARDVWAQNLIKSGHIRGMAGLHPASTATTLRERNGKLMISDGPFADTTEALAGYHMVECRDLDEAIAIAARFPALHAGFSLEVRPVMPQ